MFIERRGISVQSLFYWTTSSSNVALGARNKRNKCLPLTFSQFRFKENLCFFSFALLFSWFCCCQFQFILQSLLSNMIVDGGPRLPPYTLLATFSQTLRPPASPAHPPSQSTFLFNSGCQRTLEMV